ncbi:pro-sigmaK processing inhibitor BofA family protein [Halodesulfurarchaeum sp. HSR-GB]|uniref:pro-sigmaK processing inhibitor BofA family protein n=1 Tax=Halodesulfurarchaeum sp. HSR-GB TaxID=3074077 RepID=UPI00285D6A8F|nr:pro-sigmaK processing inhibitor BofA family protein [Halodesulfurarchaeum sp. HSR-GB]MDR5657317.1 pro-sigmaK processing inhibitor BofA family protein [Halodesulfurarchaeum sp. HSR-GB]
MSLDWRLARQVIPALTKGPAIERSVMGFLRPLAVNAVVGLILLLLANAIGLGVQISLVTLLVCAVLGIPGAILVILLAQFNIAFMAVLVPVFLV